MKRSLSEGLPELHTMRYLTIKQVSEITGIPSYTLRFWEKEFEGILMPSRTNGRQRRYSSEDIFVIERIKGLKDAGMSLNEIKERLGNRDEGEYQNSCKIDLLANRVARVVKAEVYNFFESNG